METFNEAKNKFKKTFVEILKETNNKEIDEAALPAITMLRKSMK